MSTAALSRPSLPANRDADLRRLTGLVRIAAIRSLKVRYRGSALGVLWSFANPILMTGMYTTIFGAAFARNFGGSLVEYLLYVFVGLVAVTFFLNATSEALLSVVTNGATLNKIPLQPAVFPLASVGANLFQQLVTTFPVVLLISAFTTHDPLRVVLVPVVLASLSLLVTGVSLALAAFYVFFRDLAYLWGIGGFMLWMTSPLFYPEALAPARVRVWFHINPVSQQLEALREVALGHGHVHLTLVAVALVTGTVACAVGAGIFRVTRRAFMDLL
jgi:lipopolysaccharide transport system permease protein